MIKNSTKRVINLPKGGQLEIEMSDAFKAAVRKQFDIQADQQIEDDHLRMFLFGAINSAVNNAQNIQ